MMTNYAIFAADCDIYYYEDANPDIFCSCCGSFVGNEKYYPDKLNITKFKKDMCFTYDGQLLLSKKAKKLLESATSSKLLFKRVNESPEIFVLCVENIVTFDIDTRKTRFEGKCDKCGNYESIVGSTPPYLINGDKIKPSDIYITDIQFGSGKEKSPLYIIGSNLAKILKNTFREIDLEEVKGNE